MLTLTTIPFSPTISKVRAQSEDAVQKRQRPPYPDLPDIGELLAEGRNPQPEKARPALKPSTICGYRDVVCKRIKAEKEKNKVGQAVSPGGSEQKTQIASAGKQSGGNWLQRFGRRIAGVFAGATLLSVNNSGNGSSFVPSAVPSAATSAAAAVTAPVAPPPPPSFGTWEEAKLDPRYSTGGAGEDLFSGNFHWSLPLVSLPGRNGLDVNIGLHYNSLIWLRWAGGMVFDYDYYATLTPGFRLGFPELSGPFQIGGYEHYIAILPSGRRVGLRKVTTNRYEATDSSYLYLVNSPATSSMTLYDTAGTQFIYTVPPGDWRYQCTKVRDSNGNYLTIGYTNAGTLQNPLYAVGTITDTLGRVISFTYDNTHLTTITQTWQNQTFTWAQFEYGTQAIQHNFGSLFVDGPGNGSTIPTITRVVTGDGARHTFGYNTWGQVSTILQYGEADNLRAQMVYAFPDTSAPLSDCPRFTQRNDYFANWAGYNWTGWVSTYFYFKPDETEGWVTPPDGVTTKVFFNTTNGTRGLPYRSETWYGGALQKFTQTTWASDSAVSPPLRPRVTETKVCDDRNHNGTYESGTDKLSRTTTDYTSLAGTVKLPYTVKEYNEGGATVYRSAQTTYITGAYVAYNRRIIGLPYQQWFYEGDADSGGTLKALTEFSYDSPNDGQTTFMQGHTSAPRQHDTASYGTGFLVRGNLTKVNRYSVVNGTASNPLETKTGYYYTGTVALTKDALNHQTSIFYDDAFLHYSESGGSLNVQPVTPSPATWAYPTRVTDADTYSGTVAYNYDFGAVTRSVDPREYATHGANPTTMSVNTYDTKGRRDKALVRKEGNTYSWTRNVYGTDHNWWQSFTTVNSTSEETWALHLLDGASRERITVSEHPGSAGGLRLSYKVFDLMGRVSEWSNPTEIYGQAGCGQPGQPSCWEAYGDDASGYKYSTQAFDWKGRPTVTTNQDYHPTLNPDSKRQITYTGCGCAGSDVIESQGEKVTYKDAQGQEQTGWRRSRAYRDVFGRTTKTEILNWDGSVYSTATNTWTVLDQVTNTSVEQGTSGTAQNAVMTWDGYGRLWKRRSPGEDADQVFTYLNNDLVGTITDARNASVAFTYNNRNQVTYANYTETGGATATPDVAFVYDAVGNRTQMAEAGLGQVDYYYDTLNRLEKEERQFTGGPSGLFTLRYTYNLTGQVQTLTDDRFGTTVTYGYDKTGRMLTVGGGGWPGVSQFQSNALYRAWGAPKEILHSNNVKLTYGYNPRMQMSSSATSLLNLGQTTTYNYQYYLDGQLKSALDAVYPTINSFNHSYGYDHAGRLTEGLTGDEANGGTTANGPYRQTYTYDTWGNMTGRTARHWSQQLAADSATYLNNRRQGWSYDLAGNVLSDVQNTHGYDAASRKTDSQTNFHVVGGGQTGHPQMPAWEIDQSYDGNSQPLKRVETQRTETLIGQGPQTDITTEVETTWYVRSTVLNGQSVVEVDAQGNRIRASVYGAGGLLARQDTLGLTWRVTDPVTGNFGALGSSGSYADSTQMDPLGAEVGTYDPYPVDPDPTYMEWKEDEPLYIEGGDPFDLSGGCTRDGMPVSCSALAQGLERGSVVAEASTGGKPFGYWDFTGRGVLGIPTSLWLPKESWRESSNGEDNTITVHDEGVRDESTSGLDFGVMNVTATRTVEYVSIVVGEGGGWGGLAQSKRPQKPRSSSTVSPAGKKKNNFTSADCDRIRLVLSREESLGTAFASWKSSFLPGGDGTLANIANGNPWTKYGRLDLEWFANLTSPLGRVAAGVQGVPGLPIANPASVTNVYIGGKNLWTAVRVILNSFQDQNSRLNVANKIPFADPGEVTAVLLAGSPFRKWKDIFDDEFMKENCLSSPQGKK